MGLLYPESRGCFVRKANTHPNETPAQRFVRIANQKVNSLLKGMKGLGNLRGSKAISTPDQRKTIKTVLSESLDIAMQSLEGKSVQNDFKL